MKVKVLLLSDSLWVCWHHLLIQWPLVLLLGAIHNSITWQVLLLLLLLLLVLLVLLLLLLVLLVLLLLLLLVLLLSLLPLPLPLLLLLVPLLLHSLHVIPVPSVVLHDPHLIGVQHRTPEQGKLTVLPPASEPPAIPLRSPARCLVEALCVKDVVVVPAWRQDYLCGADLKPVLASVADFLGGVHTVVEAPSLDPKDAEVTRVVMVGSRGDHLEPVAEHRLGGEKLAPEGRKELVGGNDDLIRPELFDNREQLIVIGRIAADRIDLPIGLGLDVHHAQTDRLFLPAGVKHLRLCEPDVVRSHTTKLCCGVADLRRDPTVSVNVPQALASRAFQLGHQVGRLDEGAQPSIFALVLLVGEV